MKWISKHIWWLLCTLVLGVVLLYCVIQVESKPLRFSVTGDGENQEIMVYTGTDGVHCVFLPSYAKMEQVKVVLGSDERIIVGDKVLTNGMDCGDFALDTDYLLRDTKGNRTTLRFYRSAHLPAIYINTASQSMKQINSNKDYEEHITIEAYSVDGNKIHRELSGKLKGHGNSTWLADKKPYTIKLSSEEGMLGMKSAANWVLLANAIDQTQLHNKVVLDIAKKFNTSWNPNCRYVDLYLNGEYNGLYLLTEKIECGPNRLNIDVKSGDYLCKVELEDRWDKLKTPIRSSAGRPLGIEQASALTPIRVEQIGNEINQLEETIQSGGDLSCVANFDLDSWVKRYLIDEISGNVDSDVASSYFYCRDGVFYGGPVWDYDLAFFSPSDGQVFVAKQYNVKEGTYRLYYDALYHNQSFYERMVELYKTQMVPIIEHLIAYGIQEYAVQLEYAYRMDGVRWSKSRDVYEGANSLSAYLQDRLDFLNNAWVKGINYCTVQVEEADGETYRTFSVESGKCIQTEAIDFSNTTWIVATNGIRFDPAQPIREDIVLVRDTAKPRENTAMAKDLREIIVGLSVCGLVGLLACFVGIDIKRRRKERVSADGKK